MILSELPDYPWQNVGSDLFELKGVHYLLVVDYFSQFVKISKMSSTTSVSIISALKSTFSRYEIPLTFISNNGPQYAAKEFKDFSETYNSNILPVVPTIPKEMDWLNTWSKL